MPFVFSDATGNGYDLTMTRSADWTVSSGGLPNGDNYVTGDGSIAATYNTNGDDFNIADGTAWTVEFWFYYPSGRSIFERIMTCADIGTTTEAWQIEFQDTETMVFEIANTTASSYLVVVTGVLAAATWHHLVFVKETGNTLRAYVNTLEVATDTTTVGTARTPTSSYYLYVGTKGTGIFDLNPNQRVSKLAIYNRQLSQNEISDHYLAMVAT